MHGALGAASQLEPLKQALETGGPVFTVELPGHGQQPFDAEGFSIELFADCLIQYLREKECKKVDFFGYSMGGYVALYAAQKHPGYFDRITTLATKFAWDPETARKETALLNPDRMLEKVPAFAASLQQRHRHGWEENLRQTAALMTGLGNQPRLSREQLQQIRVPCRIAVGSADKMVSMAETQWAAGCLPEGVFECLEGLPHPIEKMDPDRLAGWIRSPFKKT